MPLLDSLHHEHQKDVRFVGVFPNASSSTIGIGCFQTQFGIDFEFLIDQNQLLTKKFEAVVTPEIVLIENASKQIVYKGRIDDSYFRVGKRKTVKQTQELVDVLESINQGKLIQTISQPAIGCFIQMQ